MAQNDVIDEEIEIKVEYFESLESDPLSEKTEGCRQHCVNIDVLSGTDIDNDNGTSPYVGECSEESMCMVIPEAPKWYKSIDNVGRYICRFCELSYHSHYTLRRHINTKHPDGAAALKQAISNKKRNRKIKCHVCKMRFKTLTELQNHVEAHDIENAISCPICKAKFSNKEERSVHLLNKHNVINNMLYCCNICGYQTLKKSHYKQHANTHIESNKRKCSFCDYSSNYPPNLRIHERIHTKTMAYVCDYAGCAYKCVAKSALRSHQLKHDSDNNVLYCDKCAYTTVYMQSLRKHIDSHGRNSVRTRI